MWLLLLAILFSVNMEAQMTIGGKKEPEAFSVLELLNKGGLRLPQMTTAQRNAFAVQGKIAGEGLTIYNIDTKCVEYWNSKRWVSLCDGTSQATISPEPCVNVAADGTGCDQKFDITDPDCPSGFNITITAGSEYAVLSDVDNVNGSFKINFYPNETVNMHTVLVRVTSTCTSLYKEFLFSQKGVDCSTVPYAVPTITASGTALCAGGSVYLSVPANTANLDKLIWTLGGKEIARGVNYFVATQKGKYNISMGAVGCNTNAANEKNITESATTAPDKITISADNNGVICGANEIGLNVIEGTSTNIAWFHNGAEDKLKSGRTIQISGDSSVGEWFAAVKDGSCYSKISNILTIAKSTASAPITLSDADVLVNGQQLKTFTAFCSGGSLNLSVANKQNGITYTWYNGNEMITANPYIVPSSQSTITLKMVATDDSGVKCPAQKSVSEATITKGNTPSTPTISSIGNTLCSNKLTLTITDTQETLYTWYKDGQIIDGQNAKELQITTGGTYGATVKNVTGCYSPMTEKTISGNSSAPVISWSPTPPAQATYGSLVDFSLNTSFNPTAYIWTMDGVVQTDQTGQTATIKLPTVGSSVKIGVTAKNDCGSQTITQDIALNSACPTPVITSISNAQTITAKTSVTVQVSVTDNNAETYQWYRNTTDSTTGGVITTGKGSSYTTDELTEGVYYFYCKVINGCTGNPSATSQTAKVTVTKNPSEIEAGSGTLSGKTCFDVAEINDGGTCGVLASRKNSNKADFAKNNTFTYTFTPNGPVSNVHFQYVENAAGAGKIVESFIDNGNKTVTVTYKPTLNTAAAGKDNNSALKLTIYAIFNDGTGEKAIKLTAEIKDCACCGAYLGPNQTEWRTFMCHNLGVNQALDPFNIGNEAQLIGNYYIWGVKDPIPASPPYPYSSTDPNAWADVNGKKTVNDPCPEGYRIPTYLELQNLLKKGYNGTLKMVGSQSIDVGTLLRLPGGGVKGATYNDSYPNPYQSSSYSGDGFTRGVGISNWYYPQNSGPQIFNVTLTGIYGSHIRCIAEN